jgi:hypothetical protein
VQRNYGKRQSSISRMGRIPAVWAVDCLERVGECYGLWLHQL